jgi:hypothetical protein
MEEKENRKGKMNQNKKKIEKEDNSPPGPCPCPEPKSPAPEAGPTSPLPFPLFLSLPGGTHLSARSSPTVSPPSPVTSPELLPRHHRDLIVHQDPSIKGPDTPSLTSLLSARDCAPRLLEFLAGAPPVTLQILVDSGEEGSPRPLPPAPFSSF